MTRDRLIGMHPREDFGQVSWRPPSPALSPYVHEHWISRWAFDPGSAGYQRLHHPCVAMCSHDGRVAVSGVRRGRQLHRPHGGGVLVGTRFKPGAFALFSDLSAQELLDRHVSAVAAFGPEGDRLERELVAAGDDVDGRIELIEDFLVCRIRPKPSSYGLVEGAISTMTGSLCEGSVTSLASAHGVSTRTLQRAFQDLVGVGPKWVRRRYRIQAALTRIVDDAFDDSGALALELGYFDQSHFTNDFKAEVGVSPRAFVQERAQPIFRDGMSKNSAFGDPDSSSASSSGPASAVVMPPNLETRCEP